MQQVLRQNVELFLRAERKLIKGIDVCRKRGRLLVCFSGKVVSFHRRL